MKKRLCFFLILICCLCAGCSRKNEGDKPYTEGEESTCIITLDNKDDKEQIFKVLKDQQIMFDLSDTQGKVNIKVLDEEKNVIFEGYKMNADKEGTFGIVADEDVTYTVTVEVIETGGSLSVTIR
ncbi:hypothetical protein [Anaerolentibacter hominis]|uniref:hypothetical protein n=1 Tax=Anaerolentibacter hominis TaxID=3079009 RepID=UPI0031B847BF